MAQRGTGEKRRARYHHGDLRRALVEAALEVLAREGVAELSLREVARRAGVSTAAPYHHFPDKQSLLAAVAEEGFVALNAAMKQAREASGGWAERLEGMAAAYIQFAVKHAAHYRVMFLPELKEPRFEEYHRLGTESFELMRGAVAEARPELSEPDTWVVAVSAWSAVHGFTSLWTEGFLGHKAARLPELEGMGRAVGASVASLVLHAPATKR
ncbi:TetR/AcrR family transcriptional regulator [Archangium minus]|uniref:TetR/AcrR family transcriptional regulator n=1 Tax=Archangium minus TaxID=83450 RepID=A0ABY9WYF2_9BACT|nr:TetR/AcrR family transcriptional regulator [Archangium violaceum]WNG48170.1 TetR/AcrR family transcriptional regulator [Archangium minus]